MPRIWFSDLGFRIWDFGKEACHAAFAFARGRSRLGGGQYRCLINAYSSDPNRRMHELINNSEDLRQIEYEWERIWFNDEPSHLTPERVHGGIQ